MSADETPPLGPDDVHIWWARPDQARLCTSEVLDADERGRHAAYRQQVDKDRFLIGCTLIRHAMTTYLGAVGPVDRACTGCGKPHGKPRVAGLELSVSHSGERVALAVARTVAVGVDVEKLSRALDDDALIARVLTPAEAARVSGLPAAERPQAFLRHWTRKEAVVKATGEGLRAELSAFGVGDGTVDWPARPALSAGCRLYDLSPGDGHAGALAVLSPAEVKVTELVWEPLR